MTTRQIEECFEQEGQEEEEYNVFISIRLHKKTILIVVDPFAINIQDLVHADPKNIALVRVRRPFWGRGDLHRYIHLLET